MSNSTSPTVAERLKAGLVWFVAGGAVLAVVTLVPGHIVGFADDPSFRQFIVLSALVIAIAGAIYGRYPPGLK